MDRAKYRTYAVPLPRSDRFKEGDALYKGPGFSGGSARDPASPGPVAYASAYTRTPRWRRPPKKPVHTFGSEAHSTEFKASDLPGPDAYDAREASATLSLRSPVATVPRGTRDARGKTYFGPGAPPVIPFDTPGPGAYEIRSPLGGKSSNRSSGGLLTSPIASMRQKEDKNNDQSTGRGTASGSGAPAALSAFPALLVR